MNKNVQSATKVNNLFYLHKNKCITSLNDAFLFSI